MELNYRYLRQIIEDNSEPQAPIIDNGVLLKNTILTVFGAPKARKSFFAMNCGIAIACGEDFCGFSIPKPEKVLFCSGEGGYFPNRDRLKVIAKDVKVDFYNNFAIAQTNYLPLNHDDNLQSFTKLIEKLKPRVVLLDPLVKFHNMDENSASLMGEIFGKLRELMEIYELSLIIPHHTGKVKSRGGRGSSVIHGEYDSAITLDRKGNDYTLRFDMRHVETPNRKLVSFNTETLWFENATGYFDVLLSYISEHGSVSKSEAVTMWESNGTAKSTAYRWVQNALESGIVIEQDNNLVLPE